MSSEAELVLAIWESVRDQLSQTKRLDFAKDLLYALAEYGFESQDLSPVVDEDEPELTEAYQEVFPPLEDDDLYGDGET